jgi:hypothetical protein
MLGASTQRRPPMTAQDLAKSYIACWNETDPARRRSLIAETWTSDASYVDPMMKGEGREGIDAMIGAVQQKYPGFRFSLEGAVDAHNDALRFGWSLSSPDGAVVAYGLDFGFIAADGRLSAITGFLEPQAQAA